MCPSKYFNKHRYNLIFKVAGMHSTTNAGKMSADNLHFQSSSIIIARWIANSVCTTVNCAWRRLYAFACYVN